MKKYILFILVLGLVVNSGCNKKATNVSPLIGNEPAAGAATGPASAVSDAGTLFEKTNTTESAAPAIDSPPEELALETIYFDFDKAALSAAGRDRLARNAQILRRYPQLRVLIEGHCDERGTIEYNLALGDRRAYTVKKYFTNYGIDAVRLSTISYGKERPAVRENTSEAWAKNRRCEFVIIK